jgi:penicillin-binding protein 1A
LPVEVWTRFMRAAHQGVPVASLPASQAGGFLSNFVQAASQASVPPAPSASAPPALLPISGTGRTAPARTSARPEAAAGLDGWLMDRLFGR